jgi:hypothetical protein
MRKGSSNYFDSLFPFFLILCGIHLNNYEVFIALAMK